MSRIPLVDVATTTGTVRADLDAIQATFGGVPAMFRVVANSPVALASMWGAFGALGGGTLGAALGEQIAVAVANRNACEYCLAAHTALGRKAGVSREDLTTAQTGESSDPRTAAVLHFALALVAERGHVPAEAVQVVREAGLSDEEIVEVVAHVALNLFTNYVNVALEVPIDFPTVGLRRAA